jgi:hypothetical protein
MVSRGDGRGREDGERRGEKKADIDEGRKVGGLKKMV